MATDLKITNNNRKVTPEDGLGRLGAGVREGVQGSTRLVV